MIKLILTAIVCLLLTVISAVPIDNQTKGVGEYGNQFEGDMVLNEEQLDAIISPERNGLRLTRFRWPSGVVTFEFSPEHNKEQNDKIENALRKIEEVSCIRFRQRTDPRQNDYIQIINGDGCYSAVGYQGRKQELSLNMFGCLNEGTIIHEFFHALGFYHMQSAFDRDDYVIVFWDNIMENQKHNFHKSLDTQVAYFNTSYDLDSIMHYEEFAFSINGEQTMIPVDVKARTMGQRDEMTPTDILKINRMYECEAKAAERDPSGKPYLLKFCKSMIQSGLLTAVTEDELNDKDRKELIDLAIKSLKAHQELRPEEAEQAQLQIDSFESLKKRVENETS